MNGEATKNGGKHDEGGYLSYLDLRPLGLEEFKAKNIDDGYPIDDMDFYDIPNFNPNKILKEDFSIFFINPLPENLVLQG